MNSKLGLFILIAFFALQVYTFPAIKRIALGLSNELTQYEGMNEHEGDPGRLGLWKLNIDDWLSSPKTFLFGRGLDSPDIRDTMQHNVILRILVKTGIVGLLFFVFFLFAIFYTLYKNKKFKFTLAPLLILLTVFSLGLIDLRYPQVRFFLFILFFIIAVSDRESSSAGQVCSLRRNDVKTSPCDEPNSLSLPSSLPQS